MNCSIDDYIQQDEDRVRNFVWELVLKGEIYMLKSFFSQVKYDITTPLNPIGMTPLHIASTVDNLSVVQYFVKDLHAPINYKDNNGRTPLHYSCSHGLYETVDYLIENGADVNAKTDGLDTPLMKAGLFRQAKIILYLMNCQGIDLYAKNYAGLTFFDIIKNYEEAFYQKIYQEYQIRCEELNNEMNNNHENNNNNDDEMVEENGMVSENDGREQEIEGIYTNNIEGNVNEGEDRVLFIGKELEFIDS